jgi:hypothetical protein
MTDEQVRDFVDGYYPACEMYTETLRRGAELGEVKSILPFLFWRVSVAALSSASQVGAAQLS